MTTSVDDTTENWTFSTSTTRPLTTDEFTTSSSTIITVSTKRISERDQHIAIFISVFIPLVALVAVVVLLLYIKSYRKKVFQRPALRTKKSIIDDTFMRFSRHDEQRFSKLLNDMNAEDEFKEKSGTVVSCSTFELTSSNNHDKKTKEEKE
jgi:hypothetical protein